MSHSIQSLRSGPLGGRYGPLFNLFDNEPASQRGIHTWTCNIDTEEIKLLSALRHKSDNGHR